MLSVFLTPGAKAGNYYFSTSVGDDSRTMMQASNPATPWKTINKLNAYAANLTGGDTVLFKRGDTFYGAISVKKSGDELNPIVFDAYGLGDNPVISGLTTVNTWDYIGKGIYQSSCILYAGSRYQLIIDGVQQAIGRYPNTGYLAFEFHIGNSSIVDNELPGSPNWTNADVVIKKNRWIIDVSRITVHAANRISYEAVSPDEPKDGFGYFIQNDPETLDQFGEWYFEPVGKKIGVFFGSDLPAMHRIEISTVSDLVNINGLHDITFQNLSFRGAGVNTFRVINAQNILIQGCNIDLSGSNAIVASGSVNFSIQNNRFNHSLNNAINTDIGCTSTVVKNNVIKNTGLIEGMGNSGTGTYQAITSFGNNGLIELNKIDSTGYNGIYFGGNHSLVKNNIIQNFCLVKDDGGGIYAGDWKPWLNKKIIGNIILNGRGAGEGTDQPYYLPVEGIYVDDRTSDVTIEYNTVAHCAGAGIKIHNAQQVYIKNNTLYNNGIQLLMAHDNIAPGSPLRIITITNNILFSKSPAQWCLNIYSVVNDIASTGRMDSNYYCRPTGDNVVIQTVSNRWSSNSITKDLSLSGWQANYRKDLNSKITAVFLTDATSIRFEYNDTGKSKRIAFNESYIGIDSTIYVNNVTLAPYASIILLKQANVSTR